MSVGTGRGGDEGRGGWVVPRKCWGRDNHWHLALVYWSDLRTKTRKHIELDYIRQVM